VCYLRSGKEPRKTTRTGDTTVTTTTCRSYILAEAKRFNRAFGYLDLTGAFAYGTLRNEINKLRHEGKILKIPKENPARYILPEWASRPEYSCVQKSDTKSMGVKFDFLSFLENLRWNPFLAVHALKLRFEVYSLGWLGTGWEYNTRNHSYRRHFNLSYPVSVQCFDTGTVLVSVKSSVRPFRLDLGGLMSLACLLGELRACLRASCIPEPLNWLIVQWHLNRDSEKISMNGFSFHVTFRDFFDNVARLYFKHELNMVRAEAIQSPKQTVKEVFERVLNREEAMPNG
jgi:hypothetical protein